MRSAICNYLKEICSGKNILILGFGREGTSTYQLLREIFPDQNFSVADNNIERVKENFFASDKSNLIFYKGDEKDFNIHDFDLIFKSPGIPQSEFRLNALENKNVITSQTEIFLRLFREQIIGITGTKGKSTTTTLIYRILENAGKKVILAGNIGIPFFSTLKNLETPIDYFVCELSSHQLQFVDAAPKYAALLNLYEEHLDFYDTVLEYWQAKLNIFRYQQAGDYCIYFSDHDLLAGKASEFIEDKNVFTYTLNKPVSASDNGCYLDNNTIYFKDGVNSEIILKLDDTGNLQGKHNLQNIMAAIILAKILSVENEVIANTIRHFKGLPHRMELVGEFEKIIFYNDSISTIPEAAMYSVETLKNVGTLILGGMDRGVDYSTLIDFLSKSEIDNLIFIDRVGEKLYRQFLQKKIFSKVFFAKSIQEAVDLSFKYTPAGKICLLSPAAASYGTFKNFEERGSLFARLVRDHKE